MIPENFKPLLAVEPSVAQLVAAPGASAAQRGEGPD